MLKKLVQQQQKKAKCQFICQCQSEGYLHKQNGTAALFHNWIMLAGLSISLKNTFFGGVWGRGCLNLKLNTV